MEPGPATAVPAFARPSAADDERRRALRRMKLVAGGALVLAAVAYLISQWVLHHGAGGWAGFLRAFSEAGMVGGLADWFAVTALFRHPLGIPIWHTAIIPRKKDQLGESLGEFVGENFLDPVMVGEKVRSARIPERVGRWLLDPAHRRTAGDQAAKAVRSVLAVLRDDDMITVIERTVVARVAEPRWGPPAGRLLERLLDEGRHLPLLDLVAERAYAWVDANPQTVERWVTEKAPAWAPQFVNELLGERAYRELHEWTWQIRSDRGHAVRGAVVDLLRDLARDMQHDPTTIERVEKVKRTLLEREEVRRAAAAAWTAARGMVLEASLDDTSALRRKIDDLLERVARALVEDEALRSRIDDYTSRTAHYVAENYAGEVTSIISETVERWDADQASEKIELLAGRDLQFIRINGTVVGGLAGLVIHLVTVLAF